MIDAVNGGMSHRATALKFGVGRTQINSIVHEQKQILDAYTQDSKSETKYLAARAMQYPELDRDVWEFFCEACAKKIPVSGPMLLSEANESALRHGYDKFQASNGWMTRFCSDIK